MRYIKVLLLVVLVFFVMLFFMDNQAALTSRYDLTLNLRFLPAWNSSSPVPCYFLLLGAFLVGAVSAITMLLWDRLTLGTRAGLARLRANSLERDLGRAVRNAEKAEAEIKRLQETVDGKDTELKALQASVKDKDEELKALQASAKQPSSEDAKA